MTEIFIFYTKSIRKKQTWGDGEGITPGRLTMSKCSSDSISENIDHFLDALAITHNSYVRDIICLLITLHLNSLYNNIDNKYAFKALNKSFNKNPEKTTLTNESLNCF